MERVVVGGFEEFLEEEFLGADFSSGEGDWVWDWGLA